MKWIFIAPITFIAVVFLGVWFDRRDVEMNQAAIAYEQCVQREYGMTPIKWYEQHQKYPTCGN